MAALIDLSGKSKIIRMAAHAVGMDYQKPYIRHKKLFYKPYRNYYSMSTLSADRYPWVQLVSETRATFQSDGQCVYFHLTRNGLDWLGKQLNVTIHDEED